MSWSALASNQCVSCNNLQDAVNTSVFVLKNTIPVSTKQITVAEAENYVYIAPINKASNELVVKSNLIAGFTYYFSYATTSALACPNNDPIAVVSNTNPIGVGSILSNPDGSQAAYPYYYSDGTNWYFADSNASEQTVVQSTGSCNPLTQFYIQNSSLDIQITDVTVNGVSLTGATGSGFPVNPSETISAYSNQQGTQNVLIYFNNSITGQHIEGYDSNLTFYCDNISGTGSNVITWSGAFVGSGTFQIYAYDGSCA